MHKELKMRGGLRNPSYSGDISGLRPVSAPFAPRTPEIKALAGSYTLEPPPLYKAYKASGSKLKYSRWLHNLGLSETEVKEAVEQAKPITYTVSVSFKAILRCSITRHYESCYSPTGSKNRMPYNICKYLPSFGIVYVADRKGDYTNRFFIGITEGLKEITFFRPYGERAVTKQVGKDLERRLKKLGYTVTTSGESPFPITPNLLEWPFPDMWPGWLDK